MFIYFIREAAQGLVKIGLAQRPNARLSQLQAMCPHLLELVGVVRGSHSHEKRLHEHFADSRVRGEWFEPTQEMNDFLEKLPAWTPETPPDSVPIFSAAKNNLFFDLYRAGYSQTEIGEHFGFSRQRAHQLIAPYTYHKMHGAPGSLLKPPAPKTTMPLAAYIEKIGGKVYHPLAVEF